MRPPTVALVAILVVLAGCTGIGPGTTTPTTTPPTTAAPTTTTAVPTTPGSNDSLAPGVTVAGIVNPVALMNAHQRALLADGFVLNQTVVVTEGGRVETRTTVRTASGPDGEVGLQTGTAWSVDPDGNASTILNDVWMNTATMVSRHVEAGTATYRIQPRLFPPEALVWFSGLQADIQSSAADYVVTGGEGRNGLRLTTLEATLDRVGNDGVPDTNSTLVVDGNGVIREATMSVRYGEATTYTTTYRVEALGTAAPSPPDWVATVPPSAALQVGLDVFEFDGSAVRLVHTYGDAVPKNSTVELTSNGTTYRATLAAPFGSGERYLWIDSDGRLRVTTERPVAAEPRPLARVIAVTVTAPDGGELYATSVGRRG